MEIQIKKKVISLVKDSLAKLSIFKALKTRNVRNEQSSGTFDYESVESDRNYENHLLNKVKKNILKKFNSFDLSDNKNNLKNANETLKLNSINSIISAKANTDINDETNL